MPEKNVSKQAVKRRIPAQERSQHKIELILEAVTRILHKQGKAALTTNQIAAVSGVSIGTIYQYFSNKEEILAQLAQRERSAVMRRVMDAALEFPNSKEILRVLVREMLGAFNGRSRVYKELIDLAIADGRYLQGDPSYSGVSMILQAVANENKTKQPDWNIGQASSAADNFVLTHAFLGIIRAYARDGNNDISSSAIEDALVRLVQKFTT
jgi:AcrR family transcriptional regulator